MLAHNTSHDVQALTGMNKRHVTRSLHGVSFVSLEQFSQHLVHILIFDISFFLGTCGKAIEHAGGISINFRTLGTFLRIAAQKGLVIEHR